MTWASASPKFLLALTSEVSVVPQKTGRPTPASTTRNESVDQPRDLSRLVVSPGEVLPLASTPSTASAACAVADARKTAFRSSNRGDDDGVEERSVLFRRTACAGRRSEFAGPDAVADVVRRACRCPAPSVDREDSRGDRSRPVDERGTVRDECAETDDGEAHIHPVRHTVVPFFWRGRRIGVQPSGTSAACTSHRMVMVRVASDSLTSGAYDLYLNNPHRLGDLRSDE
jgi:hypothetical protein